MIVPGVNCMGKKRFAYQLCSWIAAAAGMAVLFVILASNMVASALVDVYEVVHFSLSGISWLVVGILLASLGAVLIRNAEQIKEERLFRVFSAGYLAAGVYLIFSITPVIRADPSWTFNAAMQFLYRRFEEFSEGGYLYTYPQQVGLMLYELPFCFFFDNARPLFFANLAEILVINWHTWQISRMLFQDNHRVNLLTIGLSFLFLPQFFFLAFAYNTIPGLTLFVMGWYWLLRWEQRPEKWGFSVLGAALLGAAVLLRSNYLIGVAAISLWELTMFFKTGQKGRLAVILAAIAFSVGFSSLSKILVSSITGATLDGGIPSVLWIAMGTDPENVYSGPGWYNDYCLDTYFSVDCNGAIASQLGREKILENLTYFLNNPYDALEFFKNKFASTWCEPTFQSIWCGPLTQLGQEVYTFCTTSLYDMGAVYSAVYRLCKGVLMVLSVSAAGFCLVRRKDFPVYGMPLIFLTGGVLFHLMWETKSQYVYPYIFMLIPLSAAGLAPFYTWLATRWRKFRGKEIL